MEPLFRLTNEQKKVIAEHQKGRMSPFSARDCDAVRHYRRRKNEGDQYRTSYGTDVDKILNNALYNRYIDKTQVFSFYRNDDITRRALHVQLVSRLARTIGQALGLNLDLIEAIALGHDIGHTPFGHRGETYLDAISRRELQRGFLHNVHSVRVLMEMTKANLTLQTYDGILCHCGEDVDCRYEPTGQFSEDDFLRRYEDCYVDSEVASGLRPATLEGCVVRLSDLIAFSFKDRQDAKKIRLKTNFQANVLGDTNDAFLGRIICNILKNSLEQPFIAMDSEIFAALKQVQRENYAQIYQREEIVRPYEEAIRPMMEKVYARLVEDVDQSRYDSPVFRHHLNHPILGNYARDPDTRFIELDTRQIVIDYIASMTDDYLIDVYRELFGEDGLFQKITYHFYFEI